MGGLSGIHQFVRIGRGAIIGALTMVTNDVVPYGMVTGERGKLRGLNIIGLKRKGLSKSVIAEIKLHFDKLFDGENSLRKNVKITSNRQLENLEINEILKFVLEGSDRSFLGMEKNH